MRLRSMTVKTTTMAAPFRWIRYSADDFFDVLHRRKIGRALPGYWDWTPKQREEIRAQYPELSDEDFDKSYWVCEGACMLCGEPLSDKQHCSASTKWFSLIPRDRRRHTTHFENLIHAARNWRVWIRGLLVRFLLWWDAER